MLIGLIADVHSNKVALKAVPEELDELRVKIILHAGDIVGYNPYPDETIRTKYDIEKVIQDMLAANLPEALAYRLRVGH